MHGLYTSGPAAYGSIANLQKASGLSRKKVEYFLHGNETYTKFRSARKTFPRLKVFAKDVNEIWSADLAFVEKLARQNSNTKYLLLCIDVLSRFIRVQPMKNKYARTTKDAFQKILKNVKPKKLWVDAGTEFGGEFRKFCENNGIHIYHTQSETKSCMAERAIRSLKAILYKYMSDRGTNKYLGQLQRLVNTLNSRVNRSIKMPPKDVRKQDVPYLIGLSLSEGKFKKPKLTPGMTVRLASENRPFKKGYKAQFSDQLFKIVKIATTVPIPTYVIRYKNGPIVEGKMYESELIRFRE